MTHAKNICLLGFSKQAEQVIKTQLAQRCPEYDFIWVSANANTLDGIIINAMFLDTPQIKKYVSTVTAPCVSVYTQDSGREVAGKHGLLTTQLRDTMEFENSWLNTLLVGRSENGASNQDIKPNLGSVPRNTSKDYINFIKLIKDKESVYIRATSGDKTTYLSPTENNAYINFARGDIPGVENWEWEKIDNIPNTDAMRRINIDQWLFETIWQSQTETFAIDTTMFYKLIRWPQPFSQRRRSEALRLAAQIKFHPVKISDLVEKTQFSSELIEQFLYATNQAGQIEVVAPTKETILENKRLDTPRNDPDRETKRSFIGRLRAKLGL